MRTKQQKPAVLPTPTSIAPDVGPRSNGPQWPRHRQVNVRPAGRLDAVDLQRDSGLDNPEADDGTLTLPDVRVDHRERRL